MKTEPPSSSDPKKQNDQTPGQFSPFSGLGFAYRVSTEFISGILLGLLIGYAIDQIFKTQPWGIVIFVILGAAGGIMNIARLLGLWGSDKKKIPPNTGEKKDG